MGRAVLLAWAWTLQGLTQHEMTKGMAAQVAPSQVGLPEHLMSSARLFTAVSLDESKVFLQILLLPSLCARLGPGSRGHGTYVLVGEVTSPGDTSWERKESQ